MPLTSHGLSEFHFAPDVTGDVLSDGARFTAHGFEFGCFLVGDLRSERPQSPVYLIGSVESLDGVGTGR